MVYRKYILYPRLETYLYGKVLDVGCGIGDFLKYYKSAVGVDINPENVKSCQEQGFNVELMKQDKLPFETNSFDSIVMDNVLEHIADPEEILMEIKRVLQPNGVLLIGVPGLKGYASDPDHKVFYSKKSLLKTLVTYGFKNTKLIGMPFSFEPLSKWIRQYCIYGVFQNIGVKS